VTRTLALTKEAPWAGQTMTLPGLSRVLNFIPILDQNPMSQAALNSKGEQLPYYSIFKIHLALTENLSSSV